MNHLMGTALFAAAVAVATPVLAQTATTTLPTATGVPAEGGIYYGKAYDWRVSKFMGSKVMNNANETIGDINDVLIDKEGKVSAVVIGVGGFLGLGERNVAVSFNALNLSRDANGMATVKVNATKDSLKGAPEWKWQMSSK
jgi:sporulation protein YlmC with PRC-barrel domain